MPMVAKMRGYSYGAEGVRLHVKPQPTMTWGMWGNALMGLRMFGEAWEFVVLEFDVYVQYGRR